MHVIPGMKKDGIRKSEQDGWSDVHLSDFQEIEQANDVDSLNNLDDDERTQLMIENERLYFQSLQVDSDIQKVEKQMAELHQLQETFAEKVNKLIISFLPGFSYLSCNC